MTLGLWQQNENTAFTDIDKVNHTANMTAVDLDFSPLTFKIWMFRVKNQLYQVFPKKWNSPKTRNAETKLKIGQFSSQNFILKAPPRVDDDGILYLDQI